MSGWSGRSTPALRNVLIVHYHFLPVHNVAVKRLVGYAKSLPCFGWRAHILTRDWHGIEEADASWGLSWEPHLERDAGCVIHRAPDPRSAAGRPRVRRVRPPPRKPARATRVSAYRDRLAGKFRRLGRIFFGPYPDEFVGWVRPAVAAGLRVARDNRIDAIMSYCPPETNHLVARRLALRLDVPWVPFFGDLDGFLDAPLPRYSLEGALRRKWHRWCLAPAAACAGISPSMASYLARTYRKRTELIHTGFDPHDFPESRGPIPARPRFVVSHIGSVYPGDQRPEIFFDGLDLLLARRPEIASRIEVRFVGSKCDDGLHAMLAGRPAARVCAVEPKVDSATAIGLVRDSDALLAFTCTHHRDRHGTLSYPTKIFEAFGARRPVLAVPADGDWVDELLTRTAGGVSARDAADVAAVLAEWFLAWSRDGRVPYQGRSDEIADFSRDRQVERLGQLLDSVCRR